FRRVKYFPRYSLEAGTVCHRAKSVLCRSDCRIYLLSIRSTGYSLDTRRARRSPEQYRRACRHDQELAAKPPCRRMSLSVLEHLTHFSACKGPPPPRTSSFQTAFSRSLAYTRCYLVLALTGTVALPLPEHMRPAIASAASLRWSAFARFIACERNELRANQLGSTLGIKDKSRNHTTCLKNRGTHRI